MRHFSVSKSYEFKDSFNNEWIVEIFPIPGGVRYHDHDDIFATFQCEFRKVYGEGSFSLTVNMVKQIHVYSTETLHDEDFKNFTFPTKKEVLLAASSYFNSLLVDFLNQSQEISEE